MFHCTALVELIAVTGKAVQGLDGATSEPSMRNPLLRYTAYTNMRASWWLDVDGLQADVSKDAITDLEKGTYS